MSHGMNPSDSTPDRLTPPPSPVLQFPTTFSIGNHPPTRLAGNLQGPVLDVYYEVFPTNGQLTPAVTARDAHRAAETGAVRLPSTYQRTRTTRVVELLERRDRDQVLNLLGVLWTYGTLTNNQAAAFTSHPPFADPRSHSIARLFNLGLIRIGPPFLNQSLAMAGTRTVIYQAGEPAAFRELFPDLTYAEWLAITAAQTAPLATRHPRHDTLAAELALRLAELVERDQTAAPTRPTGTTRPTRPVVPVVPVDDLRVGTVLGPLLSQFHQLLPSTYRTDGWTTGGPDLTLVRSDGLRVAIEVTATIGQHFHRKVRRWNDFLTLTRSGLVVVFLTAPTLTDRGRRGQNWPGRDIAAAITTTYRTGVDTYSRFTDLRTEAGSQGREAPKYEQTSRMLLADWTDWFPTARAANQDFPHLPVIDPTTGATVELLGTRAAQPLDTAARLDGYPTAEHARHQRQAVILNSSILGQTPARLRTHITSRVNPMNAADRDRTLHHADQPDRPAELTGFIEPLTVALLRRAAGPVPAPAPYRNTAGRRVPGIAQGAARPTLFPPRLVGPAITQPVPINPARGTSASDAPAPGTARPLAGVAIKPFAEQVAETVIEPGGSSGVQDSAALTNAARPRVARRRPTPAGPGITSPNHEPSNGSSNEASNATVPGSVSDSTTNNNQNHHRDPEMR